MSTLVELQGVKASILALFLLNLYSKVTNSSWHSIGQSETFASYRKLCERFVSWLGPGYTPLLEDGETRQKIPSQSERVFALPPLDASECVSLESWKLRGLVLKNRVIRAAAYDGVDVSKLEQVHEELARYGVGMTVLAYCSVSSDGRTFDGQLVLTDGGNSKEVLIPVVKAVHQHGTAICAQLTHAGSFAHRDVIKTQPVSASVVLNIGSLGWPRAATIQDLNRLCDDFVCSAHTAIVDCGFDAVEIHLGHGYLLSQFLSPAFNLRTDEYGGDQQRRARFPCEVIQAVRKEIGEKVPIIVKMNAQDGLYGGLELPDALLTAELVTRAGADLIVVTTGFVGSNSFYMLRGANPIDKLVESMPEVSHRLGALVFGPLVIPAVPFEECFLRDSARAVLRRVKKLGGQVCLMGGVSSLSDMEGAIREGFSAVQMSRALIREPDFLVRIQREMAEARPARVLLAKSKEPDDFNVESKCIRCNECVVASVDPTRDIGCPFRKMELHQQAVRHHNQVKAKLFSNDPLTDIEDLVFPSSKM